MGTQESILRLRLLAMNEATPAFEEAVKSLSELAKAGQETSRIMGESWRNMTLSVAESSREMVTSFGEEGRGVSELRNTIETSLAEAANGMATSVREMTESSKGLMTSFEEEGRGASELRNTIERCFTESARITAESFKDMTAAADINAKSMAIDLSNIEYSINEVARVIQENTRSAEESFAGMGRASTQAHEQSVGLWHDMGGIIGLQMMADEARKAGQELGHMFEGAVKDSAQFESSVSSMKAALVAVGMPIDTANQKTDQLKQSALDLGSHYHRSANEIAESFDLMIRQGVNADIVLQGAGRSAVLVSLVTKKNLGETATVISDVYNTFKEQFEANGKSMEENFKNVGNVLSGTMLSARISMDDYLNTMKYAGSMSSVLKTPIEDLSTAMAALAKEGIRGSQAGTTLKRVFTNLVAPTKDGAKALSELGIIQGNHNLLVDEATGKLKPLSDIHSILAEKFKNLTDVQKVSYDKMIFGQYALGGSIILTNQSAEAFGKLHDQISKVDAERSAAIMMDNLSGDMMLLEANATTLSKMFGDTVHPIMRAVAQTVDDVVQSLTRMDPEVKKAIMIFGGISAAALTVAGALGSSAIAITLMKPGFEIMGEAAGKVASFFGMTTTAAEAATVAVGELTVAEAGASGGGLLSMLGGLGGGIASGLKGIGSVIEDAVKGPFRLLGSAFKTIKEFDTAYFLANARASIGLFIQSAKETLSITNILNTVKGAFSAFGEFVMGLGPKILTFVRTAFSWEGITAAASTALEVITGPWGMLVLGIAAGVGAIIANWDTIKGWVTEHFGKTIPMSWSQLKDDAINIFNDLKQFFASVWDSIKQKITEVWNYIGPTITNAIKTISDYWKQIWPELKDLFVEVWHVMAVALAPAAALIGTIIVAALGFIKGAWHDAWNAIKDALKLVWDLIVDVLRVAWDVVSGIFKVALDILTGHWSDAWNDMVNMLKNILKDVGKLFDDFVTNALNFGKDLVMGIAHGIEGAIQYVIAAARKVVSAITSVFSSAPSAPSVGGEAPPSIVGFNAEGTDNWRGGPTWVGEKGPELLNLPKGSQIIPNNKAMSSLIPSTMSMGSGSGGRGGSGGFNAGGITININGVGKDGKQIGNDIVGVLRQQYNFAI